MAFNPDDFKEDDDFKSFIATSVASAVGGLESNVTKLKDDLKKAKEKQSALTTEELAELQRKATGYDDEETKRLESKGEYDKLIIKLREQHTAEVTGLKTELETSQGSVRKYLVDGGLATALAEANTNPVLLQAAVRLLSDDISVIEEDGIMVAKVGDKSISEFVGEWAKGDIGKNFTIAPNNSGGGGKPGGEGGKYNADDAAQYFDPKSDRFNLTEQVKLRAENPDLHKQLIEKFGAHLAHSVTVDTGTNSAAGPGGPRVPNFQRMPGRG